MLDTTPHFIFQFIQRTIGRKDDNNSIFWRSSGDEGTNGIHEPGDAGRAATGRDVPARVLHGVLRDLGRLAAAALPQGLRVARVREVSLCFHLFARPVNRR